MQLSVLEVTPGDKLIMRLRLKHSLGFMSVIAVYALTEVCETGEGNVLRQTRIINEAVSPS